MIVGVVKETFANEQRVALVPTVVPSLINVGLEVVVEAGSGDAAGFPDRAYQEKGARLESDRPNVIRDADILLQVRTWGANPEAGRNDLEWVRPGQVIVGLAEPLMRAPCAKEFADRGAVLFAMELLPRITRAQGMDVLSSMATIAGYKAVLLAANASPKIFPMMMTAAGTIKPARVFVLGAGVAGLQAIATAHRLGATIEAYDLRSAVKEQVESLGARFVELPLDTAQSENRGGYAKAMDDTFYRQQRELLTRVLIDKDVVITTAAVPGKKAPILLTEAMVKQMMPGSVIVDLAAEHGGNCELTEPGTTTVKYGVTLIGPIDVPSMVPYHASQMYAKNIATFLLHLIQEGQLIIDMEDEITRETLVCRDGQVTHPHVREALGLATREVAEGDLR